MKSYIFVKKSIIAILKFLTNRFIKKYIIKIDLLLGINN